LQRNQKSETDEISPAEILKSLLLTPTYKTLN
ncbi:unnamed protein product, partial [marine sediment metagenome]